MIANDPIAAFIIRHLPEGALALDIGANTGLYTRLMSRAVGPKGVVFSFEPHPQLSAQLQKEFADSNVIVYPLALSDQVGEVPFFLDERPGMHGVASSINVLNDLHSQNQIKPVTVRRVTLDEFFSRVQLSPIIHKD